MSTDNCTVCPLLSWRIKINLWSYELNSLFVSWRTSAESNPFVMKDQAWQLPTSKGFSTHSVNKYIRVKQNNYHLPYVHIINDDGSMLVIITLTEDTCLLSRPPEDLLKMQTRPFDLTTSHFVFHHDLVGLNSNSCLHPPFLYTSEAMLRLPFPAVWCPSAFSIDDERHEPS